MNKHNRPIELPDGDAIDGLVEIEPAVLLEFYTSGCGACAAMDPVLGVVGKQTDAVIATCNPGNDIGLVDEYGIRSVPTLILFVDGEEVERRMEGFVGADDLLDLIAEHAPEAVPERTAERTPEQST